MHKKLRAVALCATIALTAGGLTTAQAHHPKSGSTSKTKLTGGETKVALNDATKSALTSAGITVTPIAPATSDSGGFTFPIAGGKVKTGTAFGFVAHKGGVKLTKGDTTLKLKHLLVASGPRGAAVFVFAGRPGFAKKHGLRKGSRSRGGHGHKSARASHNRGRHLGRRGHWVRVLSLSNVKRADANGKVVITADAALTKKAAKLLNRKFATTVFSDGQAVGTVMVSATS